MDAAAHNPAFAKKAGVPVSVAKDFSEKSKGVKFGGPKTRPDLQKINEPNTRQGKAEFFNKGGDTMASKMNPGMMAMMAKKKDGMHKMPDGKMMKDSAMKKMASGGMTSALAKHAGKPASKAHAGLKDGGLPMVMKDGKKVPAFAADGEGKMKHGGMTKKMMGGGMSYAKGGGIESKGKTKGMMVKMMGSGGKK
jgi:hypothetical protein